jgi:integrase
MEATYGIDSGNTKATKKQFDLFKPVSVRKDGQRIESSNWAVRFQHQGKRTCRSLGTADYRLAQQKAKALVAEVRGSGWVGVVKIRGDQDSMLIEDLQSKFRLSAAGRGVRPRSIDWECRAFGALARDIGARRVSDITADKVQLFISQAMAAGKNPASIKGRVKTAKILFSKANLQAMGLAELKNPFIGVSLPRVDSEPFNAPERKWITSLMSDGLKELQGPALLAFALALGCGLRWGEIISLDYSNVLRDRVRVLAGHAKGRRQREVPMGAAVKSAMDTARQASGLVLGNDPASVHDELAKWLHLHGVTDAKPVHYLRKCFGSLAVADHGIFIGSKLLGHADISITAQTYANIVDKLPSVTF